MKKYNVPATEVVALVSGSFICAGSPGGGGSGGDDPISDLHSNPNGFPIEP
jgi:hypothetical protein